MLDDAEKNLPLICPSAHSFSSSSPKFSNYMVGNGLESGSSQLEGKEEPCFWFSDGSTT
jgi:hypothetical protein